MSIGKKERKQRTRWSLGEITRNIKGETFVLTFLLEFWKRATFKGAVHNTGRIAQWHFGKKRDLMELLLFVV